MEFQEALLKLMIKKTEPEKSFFKKNSTPPNAKQKWKISLTRSSSFVSSSLSKLKDRSRDQIPSEFLCPISGSLMADPVIVSSGHSFERACIQACKTLGYKPVLVDSTVPNFSTVIPNLALKSTIESWCSHHSLDSPKLFEISSAENLVRSLMKTRKIDRSVSVSEKKLIQGIKDIPSVRCNHAVTEVNRRPNLFYSSSDESVVSLAPPELATRPRCYSSSSSSEIETLNPSTKTEEEILNRLKGSQVGEIEEGLVQLRKITRNQEELRAQLCTHGLLSALRSFINSKYTEIQVNSVAALVNLSLEKSNKIVIVRSGIVPTLIDVLKGGSPEAKEHASGALFSLALEDDNKTAIGVLGALQPLLYLLRSGTEQAQHDSAMALYHLSLVESNRIKLVKIGSVPVLLNMVKSGQMQDRVLLTLCNLASCSVGRAALLNSGGVECLVGMLKGTDFDKVTRESCVATLYGLSHGGGLRFKGLAMAAGAVDVLSKVEGTGSERAKVKARRMLEAMKVKHDEPEEDVDWEELLNSGSTTRTWSRHGGGNRSNANSSEF